MAVLLHEGDIAGRQGGLNPDQGDRVATTQIDTDVVSRMGQMLEQAPQVGDVGAVEPSLEDELICGRMEVVDFVVAAVAVEEKAIVRPTYRSVGNAVDDGVQGGRLDIEGIRVAGKEAPELNGFVAAGDQHIITTVTSEDIGTDICITTTDYGVITGTTGQ